MITAKDRQFMELCKAGAQIFGTCSRRQYMAIIVDEFNHILGTGYNGGPAGTVHCADGGCPRAATTVAHGSNYDNCIAIHAEQNAFLHSDYTNRNLGGTIYVNGPPCYTCAKLIANSGIKRLVYLDDPAYDFGPTKQQLKDWGVRPYMIDADPTEIPVDFAKTLN